MPPRDLTIAQYISEYSPRHKPFASFSANEYLARSLSMIHDCYNLARWEQHGRRLVFHKKSSAFPRFDGYAPLRLAIQTTKGSTAMTAINAVRREISTSICLKDPSMLVTALDDLVKSLNRTNDVELLDIPERLTAMYDQFRVDQNFSIPSNDILKDIEFRKSSDEPYVYDPVNALPEATFISVPLSDLETMAAPIIDLDGVGILGDEYSAECTHPLESNKCLIKKWRAVARTQPESIMPSVSKEFVTKDEAIEWGVLRMESNPILAESLNGEVQIVASQQFTHVHIKEIENV